MTMFLKSICYLKDATYHAIAALFLLSAAIVYLASAVQIENLLDYFNVAWKGELKKRGINFRKEEKITAAVIFVLFSERKTNCMC